MAKKEGYIIDLNKLWRHEDGYLIRPRMLWANGKEYFAAFSNGSLSYNKAYYEFYLEDTELVALASGEIMDSYVYTSKKTDFDGKVTKIGVTDNLGNIEPNYSLTEEKKGTFSVTQDVSGFTLTGTYRQRKDSYNDEYYNLEITDIDCPLIPAAGGSRPLTIYYKAKMVRRYESGNVDNAVDVNGNTSTFDDLTIDVKGGGLFDYSSNRLSGYNLGYNELPETEIAVVKYVKISANGLTAEWSGSKSWKQEANTRQPYGELTYNLSVVLDGSDNLLPSTTYALFTASATETQMYLYTAMPDNPKGETNATTAYLSASSGASVEPTSITGLNNSVKLSFNANSDLEQKTHTVTLSKGKNSVSASVTQQAANEEYYWESPTATGLSYGEIPASGSAIDIYVIYTQRYMKKVGSNVTVDKEYKDVYVKASSITGSKYDKDSTAVVSGGSIGADSLGKNPKETTTPQYNIKGGTYMAADGNTYNFSLTGQVVQAKNVKGTITTSYAVGISPSSASLGANGGTLYFTLSATKTESFTWSSGTPDSSVTGGTASVTSTGGTVPSSVANGGTLTFYNGENTRESNLSFTITASYGGKTATAIVTQEAASYVFDYVQPGDIPFEGGIVKILVQSYMNGGNLAPVARVSGLSNVTVSIEPISSPVNGNYYVVLNVPSNNGSARSFNLELEQPNSGRKYTIPMTQKAYEAQFTISLGSESYFKKSSGQYQFYGTIHTTATANQNISGIWWYHAIDEDGVVIASTQETKDGGAYSFSTGTGSKTFAYTGNMMSMNGTSAAGFVGFRVEFRSTNTGQSFSGTVKTIK